MYARLVTATLLATAAFLFTFCSAEVINFNRCYVPRNYKPNCTVHEVRITPCAEAAENKPCRIRSLQVASISFDFTPTFTAQSPQSQASKVDTFLDKPFIDMDTNACNFMTCPLQANVKQTYTYSLNISKTYPAGEHLLKWQLWNENDHHENCCFKTSIRLLH